MCKCRSHGTFPLFGLQSSHLNICYYHQDLHRRPLRPGSRPRFCSDRRALLRIEAWLLPRRTVFRPYTQVRRTICTSVSLRASTRVSSGFAPLRHSSPSFGSRQACSHSNPSQKIKVGRLCTREGSSQSASLRLTGRIAGPHPLPSRQFQALFDSLFKVLFIFTSRYLFAIGLSPIFSLGWNLPPDWGCIPKQPDS
ncbi:unnamed protein product [Brassica rapa subsp. trilocularis]